MEIHSAGKMLENIALMGKNECFWSSEKCFGKGEVINERSYENDKVGIINEGVVYLLTINSDAQRRIIDYYQKGEIICVNFMGGVQDSVYYAIAKTDCKISFIPYNKLIKTCEKSCEEHVKLIDGLFTAIAQKSVMHIDVLGQRTLRGKLITYFNYLKEINGSDEIYLPLPLTDLADYLAVDRSAMMREIKKLNSDNIIKSDKRKITFISRQTLPE